MLLLPETSKHHLLSENVPLFLRLWINFQEVLTLPLKILRLGWCVRMARNTMRIFTNEKMMVETLTPKKLLNLALQEAERNGNNIYIICLIREYTYRFHSSTLISLPELVWGFMLIAIGYRCGGWGPYFSGRFLHYY